MIDSSVFIMAARLELMVAFNDLGWLHLEGHRVVSAPFASGLWRAMPVPKLQRGEQHISRQAHAVLRVVTGNRAGAVYGSDECRTGQQLVCNALGAYQLASEAAVS